ncbi:MAG: 5-deoxy-glucuronate isomerase [Candidatus Limnocylindrales bacterium]
MTADIVRLVRSRDGPGTRLEITPEQVGWRHLSVRIEALAAGQTVAGDSAGSEIAIVPLVGSGWLEFGGERHRVGRADVFREKAAVAYLPPRTAYAIVADGSLEVAIGGTPATGRHPARFYRPDELPSFARGGANVSRGVTATIDPTFETERLIAYEIVTPSGNWSSFPPHRHDGRFGTTAHEETYYYRLSPADGFAIQRIYTGDTDLDVAITARDGDLVLVHEGYHTVATAPGTNAYYLNFLAGEQKPVVQLNDPAYAWIVDDWTGRPVEIPITEG